jgi:hypothetical protein
MPGLALPGAGRTGTGSVQGRQTARMNAGTTNSPYREAVRIPVSTGEQRGTVPFLWPPATEIGTVPLSTRSLGAITHPRSHSQDAHAARQGPVMRPTVIMAGRLYARYRPCQNGSRLPATDRLRPEPGQTGICKTLSDKTLCRLAALRHWSGTLFARRSSAGVACRDCSRCAWIAAQPQALPPHAHT